MTAKNIVLFTTALIVLLILVFTQPANAEVFRVISDGSGSSQGIINAAISKASATPGSTVYLDSSGGAFVVDGTIIIRSNIILTGDKDAEIIVSPSSSQWFTGSIGVFSCQESLKNVEIFGFSINGNCVNLPASYANTPGHNKDCEKLMILGGYSSDYSTNIKIHDMKLYDSFSDGIYLRFATNSACYNNFISNCQHEGIFWSVVINSEMYNNQVAGITSDCLRLDNCVNCKVYSNILFSYDGDRTNGAYKHGENGIQVGDAGSSHGYDARNKPTTTTNIEIYGNTFANNGLKAIAGSMGENVYIHDNKFIGEAELETMGISVGDFKDVSHTNPPTKVMSEKIFGSIFDILDRKFTDNSYTNQSPEQIKYSVVETSQGKIYGGVKIVGFSNTIVIDNETYMPDKDSVMVQSSAVKEPSLNLNFAGQPTFTKKVTTDVRAGVAEAKMEVVMDYTTSSKGKDGKTKTIHHKTTATFNDSAKAPEIFEDNSTPVVDIFVFNKTENPVTKLRIAQNSNVQKIEYSYNGSTTTHRSMIGELVSDEKGYKQIVYSRCDVWEINELSRMGDFIVINGEFDPAKLTVIYSNPYKSYRITDYNIVYDNESEPSVLVEITKFAIEFLFISYIIYRMFKVAFN